MTPYRPCNGSEGEWFDNRFCDRCERDREFRELEEGGCTILANALVFDIDHADYPKEWIEDESGPRCTAFTPSDPSERNA